MLEVRAFNVVPGLVLAGANDEPNVVIHVERDPDTELVEIKFRDQPLPASFDYCFPVTVMGVSVNPTDSDDTDFGTADEYDRPRGPLTYN